MFDPLNLLSPNPHNADTILIFKSVGISWEDNAIAQLIFEIFKCRQYIHMKDNVNIFTVIHTLKLWYLDFFSLGLRTDKT